MRLYLSSFDLGYCPKELVALAGAARRAAIIVNALDNRPEGRAHWLKEQTNKLVSLGFSVVELDLRSYFGATDKLKGFLSSIDLVWINGGNAFILRRAMKQSGFDLLSRLTVLRAMSRPLKCEMKEQSYPRFVIATIRLGFIYLASAPS